MEGAGSPAGEGEECGRNLQVKAGPKKGRSSEGRGPGHWGGATEDWRQGGVRSPARERRRPRGVPWGRELGTERGGGQEGWGLGPRGGAEVGRGRAGEEGLSGRACLCADPSLPVLAEALKTWSWIHPPLKNDSPLASCSSCCAGWTLPRSLSPTWVWRSPSPRPPYPCSLTESPSSCISPPLPSSNCCAGHCCSCREYRSEQDRQRSLLFCNLNSCGECRQLTEVTQSLES